MDIKPRKPSVPFDFGQAVGAMFNTSGGKAFAWRLLFWVTTGLTVTMLIVLPFILPYYGELMAFNAANMQAAMSGGSPPDPGPFLELMVKMAPAYLVMMLGMWVSLAAGEAALHRKVLRDTEYPKRPVRLGADEGRVMLAQLGVWAMFFLVYMGGIFIASFFAAAFSLISPVLGLLISIPAFIAVICLVIYVPIRLAPSAALSIERERTHVMATRRVTKHRFWPLLGAYLVVAIGGYILIYFVMTIGVILVTGDANFMMTISGLSSDDPTVAFDQAALRLKNPLVMVVGVLATVLYALAMAFWYMSMAGVGSYAVKWWRDDNPVAEFE